MTNGRVDVKSMLQTIIFMIFVIDLDLRVTKQIKAIQGEKYA